VCGVLLAIAAVNLLGVLGSTQPEAAADRPVGSDRSANGATTQAEPLPLRESQLQQAPARQAPAPAPSRQAPATGSAAPQHVDTTVYDSWVVTCQDNVGGATKRSCLASLRVATQDKKVLLNWQIGSNQEGRYGTAVHVPSGLPVKKDNQVVVGPVLVANGVELKFGNGAARQLKYVTCGPRQCVAEAPIDDGFVKEALANSKATLTAYGPAGALAIDLDIKGIDKAISSTRK
jgi:invasion protein IalB